MTQPIQREGSWWSKSEAGWLRWDEEAQTWDQQAAGPPPPAPPGNGAPSTPPATATNPVQSTAVQPTATAPAATAPAAKKGAGKTMAIIAAVVVVAAAAVGGYFLLKDDGDEPATRTGGQTADVDPGDTGDTTDTGDTANTGGVTKEEFIAEADALCTEASQKFAGLTEPATPEEAGPFLIEAIAINEALYADLSALEVPADDNGEAAQAIAGLKALTDQMKTLLASIEAQEAEAIQANYDQLGVVTDEANSAAAAYGLVACAS